MCHYLTGELAHRLVAATANAILTRGLAAVVDRSLVIALPGKAGALECLDHVRAAIDHAVKLAQREPTSC